MTISRFEDALVWQRAKDFGVRMYKLFLPCRDHAFKDQIQRASVSVSNNIAEGFERKGDKEFSHFLYISKGSIGEVRSMLYLAKELKYITDQEFETNSKEALEISRMLGGFIRTL